MAFKATSQSPVQEYANIKNMAHNIRDAALLYAGEFGNGGNAETILRVLEKLVSLKSRLQSAPSIPGIDAYAKEQESDAAYDVVAELNAMLAEMDSVINLIVSSFPVSAGGYAEVYSFNADGSKTPRTFSKPQLAGLVTALENLAATVE